MSSHDASAGTVLKLLAQIAEELKLDTAGRAPDRTEGPLAARVAPEGLSVAAEIVASNPQKFADFDAEAIADAAEYVQVMLPVLERVQEITDALHASVVSKRLPASVQALALHATLKGLGRVSVSSTLKTLADKLAAAIDRREKKRPVSPQEQTARRFAKAQANKLAKAQAKVAAIAEKQVRIGPAPHSASAPTPATAPTPAAETPGVMVNVSGTPNAH